MGAPGEKVQVDVKEAPYNCLKGEAKRDGKHLYQWTGIDECTRVRYVFGYWEHTPGNSVDFLKRMQAAFPFPIQTIRTDNGTEFTYRFISEEKRRYIEPQRDDGAVRACDEADYPRALDVSQKLTDLIEYVYSVSCVEDVKIAVPVYRQPVDADVAPRRRDNAFRDIEPRELRAGAVEPPQ
jgi:hypothetical protein